MTGRMPAVDVILLAKPNSKRASISLDDEDLLIVSVKSPPTKGKANKEIIKLLSRAFGTSTSNIKIVSGVASRDKRVRIQGLDEDGLRSVLENLREGNG